MSRLILKGDTVSNFGKHLPTPYIERIEIHPVSLEEASEWFEGEMRERFDTAHAVSEWKKYFHSDTGIHTLGETQFIRIHINLSLLFNTSDQFLSDEFIQNMRDNLYINFMFLRNEQQIKNLKNSKKALLSVFNVSLFDSGFLETFRTYPLSDYTIPVDWSVERDENYNQILKIPNLTAEFIVTEDVFNAEHSAVFAASSAMDPMGGVLLQNAGVLYALNFSDVAYEDLVLGGKVAYRTGEGYYGIDGSFYTGAPIMGLNNRYHKTDNFGAQDIIDGIRSITSDYKKYQTRNKKINSALENIEYVIARFGETTELIKQLNKLSRVFPGANTSTPIGRLYTRFARAVINANSSLIEQPEVKKRLIRNVKIQDYRPFQFVSDYEGTYNSTLNDRDLLYRLYLQTNLAKYIQKPEGAEDSEAPYTSATAAGIVTEAIQTIMQRLPDWNPRSNDIYPPLKRRWASFLGGVHGEIYGQMSDFDKWIKRTIKVYPGEEDVYVWDRTGSGFWRGPGWLYLDAEWVTWPDIFGVAIGPVGESDVTFNPVAAFREWFGENSTKSDPPTTIGKCTFEYGFRLLGCDENSYGLDAGGTADWTSGPYKCFQRLAKFSRVARTRKYNETPNGPFAPPDGRSVLRIFTHGAYAQDAGEGEGGKYMWPVIDERSVGSVGTPDAFQPLWKAEDVRDHLDSVFGLSDYDTSTSSPDYDHGLSGFDRKMDIGDGVQLAWGDGAAFNSWPSTKNRFTTDVNNRDEYPGSYLHAMCRVIHRSIKGIFGSKGAATGRVNGGDLLEAATDQTKWAEIVGRIVDVFPDQSLYASDGSVNTDLIAEYAESLIARLKTDMLGDLSDWFGGEWGITDDLYSEHRDGKLTWRWCPSYTPGWSSWPSETSAAAQSRPLSTQPAILNTLYTVDSWPFTKSAHNDQTLVWDGGNAATIFDYSKFQDEDQLYAGGISMTQDIGIGVYEEWIKSSLTDIMSEFWDANFKFSLQNAIRDILTLLATLHGISYDNAEWRKLAHVNIVVQKNGWFFFDMQKYIYEQSDISQYLDPARIESLMSNGRDLLNHYIRLDSAEITTNSSFDWPSPMPTMWSERLSEVKLGATYSNSTELSTATALPYVNENYFNAESYLGEQVPKAKIKAIDAAGWEDFKASKTGKIKVDGELANKIGINAYLMLRNYDFPFENISNDYRLMSFNYNYFIDDDELIPPTESLKYVEAYKAKISIGDSSLRILIGFNDLLHTVVREVEEYLEEAQQNCAFNEFDSEFNTFFKKQMSVRYEGDPKSAPWIRGPITYVIFRDLFENAYGGDYYATMEGARQFMDAINPETGWLSGLEEFVGLLRALVDAFETHIQPVLMMSGALYSYREYEVNLPGRDDIGVVDYVNDTTGDFPDFEDLLP